MIQNLKIYSLLTTKKRKRRSIYPNSLKILNEQQLKYLSDWKRLSQQQKGIFYLGLVNVLDDFANIQDYVRKDQIKKATDGDRRRGTSITGRRGNMECTRSSGSSTNSARGEKREENLQLEPISNDFDGSLLDRIFCWLGFDNTFLKGHVPNTDRSIPNGTTFSEGSKGFYQRLDNQEVISFNKECQK